MVIKFYRVNEAYGCFSNFSKHGFVIDGKYWSTSEHYFQSQKFSGTKFEDEIRLSSSPMDAAKLGRDKSKPLRKDREKVKIDVMRKALFHKFNSHPDIKSILLSTENEIIIENTTDDYFWGCVKNGTGKNMLGKLLMQLRKNLKN